MTRIFSAQTRQHRFRKQRSLVGKALVLLVCGFPALLPAISAEAQVVGGTIAGIVTDPTGAAVQHALVKIHNEDTGTERRIGTDVAGHYAAPSVPVGAYTVTVEAAGFASKRQTGINLTIGQSTEINVSLPLAGALDEVSVVDVPAVVNDSTQQISGLVSERQVKELPLNGRSYDQLITLNPATVNYTAQRSGSIGTSNSSVGNMFAVSGRRPQDNLYLLNGVEYTGASLINVTPGGTSGQLLGVDAVREFNVVTDTYGANYGKRQGAQISIVTVSGTNSLHGSGYEFLRNSYFDSRNFFDQSRIPNYQRNNFGAAIGGPIRKNKAFLFGNYEGYRQNLGITDVTLVPDTQARAGFLPNSAGVETKTTIGPGVAQLFHLWPTQNGPELLDGNGHITGIGEAFSSPTQHIREDFGTTRFDENLTANDLFFAVYTVDDSTANTPTQNPLSLINEDLREQVLSAQEQHVFSARLLNTARVGFSRASFLFLGSVPASVQAATGTFLPGQPIGAVVIAGSTASNGSSQITGAGANVGSNNAITRNLFTFDDHIFYSIGSHQIEVGGWAQRLQSNDNLAQNQYGQASFASLSTFLTGTVKTFTIVPAPTELGWRSWFGAGYIEDTWKPLSSLEISAGLRVEASNGFNESKGRAGIYGFTNGVINTNPTVGPAGLTNNRARFLPEPRLGLAWKVPGDGKTVVRAGFGLHHSLLDNLDYRFDQAAPYNTTVTYSGVPVSAPTSGAAGLISPSSVQNDLQTPTVFSYTFRVERQIAASTSLTIAYAGSHGDHQILSEDQNEPASIVCQNNCPAGVANGTIFFPTITKANVALANTTSWVSQGSSNYNSLQVDLRRAFAGGFQFRANYTYAKNLDDGTAWNTSVSANTPAFVSYPNNPGLDYGPAATDVRHLAAFNGTYDLPFGAGKRLFRDTKGSVDRIIGGWTLSTIATLQTGLPFSPQLGYNPTGSGDTRNPVRPNINPNFHGSLYTHGTSTQRATQFFNPAAFSAPAYGTVGNLARDTLTGPGYADWDLSLLKSIVLSQNKRFQFRAEFFNILNHTNFLTSNEVVFSSGPTQDAKVVSSSGTLSVAQAAAPVQSPTAGVITAAATSRQIQLGLKFLF